MPLLICCREPGRQLVSERNVAGLRGSAVGNLDLERDGVAFIGSRIPRRKRLDRDQRSIVVDDDRAHRKVVTDGVGIESDRRPPRS